MRQAGRRQATSNRQANQEGTKGRKDERKITLICSLVHLSTRLLTTQACRHCEARSNPGL
jgi:hypothetical protein